MAEGSVQLAITLSGVSCNGIDNMTAINRHHNALVIRLGTDSASSFVKSFPDTDYIE